MSIFVQVNDDVADELARKIREIQALTNAGSSARDVNEAKNRDYKFWSTQPVTKFRKFFGKYYLQSIFFCF